MIHQKSLKSNRYFSAIWIILVVIIMFELCSASILAVQISSFSKEKQRHLILLTEETEGTKLTVSRKKLTAAVSEPGVSEAGSTSAGRLTFAPGSNPSFIVEDNEKVWTTETDVEIFKIQYDNNGDLVYTAVTSNGDKIIAPGTGNTYVFTLKNTGDVALDYILEVESYFVGKGPDGGELWIPVYARMKDYKNQWLCGDSSTWADVLDLNKVRVSEVIGAGNEWDYSLDWEWPFERGEGEELRLNDEFDTSLGNLAVDESLELHIIIRTLAEYDENPDSTGGHNPQTGDSSSIFIWAALLVVALIMMIVILVVKRRKKEEEEAA